MAIVATNAFVDLLRQSYITSAKDGHEPVAAAVVTDDVPVEPPTWDRLRLRLAAGFASGLGSVVLKQLFPNGSAPDLTEVSCNSLTEIAKYT